MIYEPYSGLCLDFVDKEKVESKVKEEQDV